MNALMSKIEASKTIRDRNSMYSPAWWFHNNQLARDVREWRKSNTLTLIK